MRGCHSIGLEDTRSNQWKQSNRRTRCTGQRGKDTHSRSGCLPDSKTLAGKAVELRWHFPSSSIQQCKLNKQIALLLLETCQVGMGSAFQIGQGSSVRWGTKSTTVMRLQTFEGKSSLRNKLHWEQTKKR